MLLQSCWYRTGGGKTRSTSSIESQGLIVTTAEDPKPTRLYSRRPQGGWRGGEKQQLLRRGTQQTHVAQGVWCVLFYKRRGRSFLRSSSIEPGALAKKKVVPLSMGVERRESPFSTRQSHVTIIQTGYLYTTPSLPTYIGYYITRTVKRLKGKKWRKLFYLIFFRLSPNSQRWH